VPGLGRRGGLGLTAARADSQRAQEQRSSDARRASAK
jgi:hypothetical protein